MKKIEDIHKFIWIEFIVWFFILCICVTGIRIYHHKKAKQMTTYQIFLPDVDGVIVGSPVKFMGVQVGYVDKIKIVSDEVYLKIVISKKDISLPKGAIATVEFNGMGGTKSLEIYPPTDESKAQDKLIVIKEPSRLSRATALLAEMFTKIDSISTKVTYFAREVGLVDIADGIDVESIEENMQLFDKIMNVFEKRKPVEESESNK